MGQQQIKAVYFVHNLLQLNAIISATHWGRFFTEVVFEFLTVCEFTNVCLKNVLPKKSRQTKCGKNSNTCDYRKRLYHNVSYVSKLLDVVIVNLQI